MGFGPLPGWLKKKRCIYVLEKFDDNFCVWRCFAIYKRLARGETNQVSKRNCDAAKNLEREYYGNKNLKKRDVRSTKRVDFKGIAKHQNVNIKFMNQRNTRERIHDLYGG